MKKYAIPYKWLDEDDNDFFENPFSYVDIIEAENLKEAGEILKQKLNRIETENLEDDEKLPIIVFSDEHFESPFIFVGWIISLDQSKGIE